MVKIHDLTCDIEDKVTNINGVRSPLSSLAELSKAIGILKVGQWLRESWGQNTPVHISADSPSGDRLTDKFRLYFEVLGQTRLAGQDRGRQLPTPAYHTG